MPEPQTLVPIDHDLAAALATLVETARTVDLGPQSKFTPDAIARIVAALRIGHTISDACTFAGVAPTTYEGWLKKGRAGQAPYAQLVELVERLNVATYSPAVECFKRGAETDPRIAKDFLAVRAPKQWGPQKEQVNTAVTIVFGAGFGGETPELEGGPEAA